jgi:hypothetical protein
MIIYKKTTFGNTEIAVPRVFSESRWRSVWPETERKFNVSMALIQK